MASEQQKDEVVWRSVESDEPSPGCFVELSRDEFAKAGNGIGKAYWQPNKWVHHGLFWRPVPVEIGAFSALVPASPVIPDDGPWYVVLAEPQQEIPTVWRMHELGLELYVPIVREKRVTNKKDKHGRKFVVMKPRPMFPGYGFIRKCGIIDPNAILKVRGARDFLRIHGAPVILPHIAVLSIYAKQYGEQQAFMADKGGRKARFKVGDKVRFGEGSAYEGMLATVDRADAKGRIEILFGMIRHTLRDDMVEAA